MKPNLRIGGVRLTKQDFRWGYTAGVVPYVWDFTMPKGEENDALAALTNPVSLTLSVLGSVTDQFENQVVNLTLENLYLQEPKAINDWQMMWSITDSRWTWRGKKVFKFWNKTNVRNDFVSALQGVQSNDPAILQQPFQTFQLGRYIPWSVRPDGSPWTVYEMMTQLFTDLGISYVEDPQGREKSYIAENVNFDGTDLSQALAELCSLGRHQIGIDSAGRVYAYSVDVFDEAPITRLKDLQTQVRVDVGTLYRQDLKRVRPAKIRVLFEKKQEVHLFAVPTPDYLEWGATVAPQKIDVPPARLLAAGYTPLDQFDRRCFACVNVIQVPYPIRSRRTGRFYELGEFAPIEDFLESLGLTDEQVRVYWFGNRLEYVIDILLQGNATGLTSVIALSRQIAAAIRKSYRQLYMIDPYYRDQIRTWDTRQVAVVDNFSRFSPPTPVWLDYCTIPLTRPFKQATSIALDTKLATNWLVDEYDPQRAQPVSAATIEVVDQKLGIFGVRFPQLIDNVIAEIIPSAVDSLPAATITSIPQAWQQASLRESHTFEAVISVVYDTDRRLDYAGRSKFQIYEYDFSQSIGVGLAPDIEFLETKEYARLHAQGNFAPLVEKETPINQTILSTLARAEAAKLSWQYKDRVVGIVKLPGLVDFRLDGNVKSVFVTFSERDGLTTQIDLRDIPAQPSLEQQLPSYAIAYLNKQVGRADDYRTML